MKLPQAFIESLPLPKSEIVDFQNSLETVLKTSVRINPFKSKLKTPLQTVPWCSNGYYLNTRPRFTSDPAFHAGGYYPQEASSMFVSHILKATGLSAQPVVALDLCAAPGGKTTILQSDLDPKSLVHANEIVPSRYNILVENLQKWGIPNVCFTNNNPADFKNLEAFYDLILVDAPCSGEGLFRKQSDAVNHWSEKAVEHCSLRQRRILSDIWPSLKPGGILIYSTCTYNRLENEENLNWLNTNYDAEFLELDVSAFSGIQQIAENGITGYRFFPHKIQGEGFFCSIIRKESAFNVKKKKRLAVKDFKILDHSPHFTTLIHKERAYALQADQLEKVQAICHHFHRRFMPGLELGRLVEHKVKFEHGLALLHGADENIPEVSLGIEDSLKYLKKEDVHLQLEKEQVIVKFNGFKIGFGKSDGKRLISQYPKNWRILKANAYEYLPIVDSLK